MKTETKTVLACLYLGICLIALSGGYAGESKAAFYAYCIFFLLNTFNAARLLNRLLIKLEAEQKKSGGKKQPEEVQSAELTKQEGAS
jgi:hypothetical protein